MSNNLIKNIYKSKSELNEYNSIECNPKMKLDKNDKKECKYDRINYLI